MVVWICLGIERPRLGDAFRKLEKIGWGSVFRETLSPNYELSVSGAGPQAVIRAYHSDVDQESV